MGETLRGFIAIKLIVIYRFDPLSRTTCRTHNLSRSCCCCCTLHKGSQKDRDGPPLVSPTDET